MSNPTAPENSASSDAATARRRLIRAKIKATAIHLLVSVMLFLPFLYLLFFIWYPMPYFVTDGGWQGVRIMLAVDLVIGPFLTALVYNPDKTRRALAVDYTFISIVQATALAYGAYSVESQKPLVVSMHAGVFTALVEDRFTRQGGADTDKFEALSSQRPPIVFAPMPAPEEVKPLIDEGVKNGLGAHELARRFLPLHEHLGELPIFAIDMEYASEDDSYLQEQWQAVLQRHPGKQLYFFRLDGRFRKALVALDETGLLRDWIFLKVQKPPTIAPATETSTTPAP